MHKQKKKLALGAETLRVLSNEQLDVVNGAMRRLTIELSLCWTACDGGPCYTFACTSFTGCI